MNALKWVIVLVLYTAFAVIVAANSWHGEWIVLHVFNIGLGVFNLVTCIGMGLRYGWTS